MIGGGGVAAEVLMRFPCDFPFPSPPSPKHAVLSLFSAFFADQLFFLTRRLFVLKNNNKHVPLKSPLIVLDRSTHPTGKVGP